MGWRFYLIRCVRMQIGKSLVLPNFQRRYDNNNGLRIDVIQRMRRVLRAQEVNWRPAGPQNTPRERDRSHKCVEEIVGREDYKTVREKLNNKIQIRCNDCNNFLCKVQSTKCKVQSTKYKVQSTKYIHLPFCVKHVHRNKQVNFLLCDFNYFPLCLYKGGCQGHTTNFST